MSQHTRQYCPLREDARERITREGRKVMRPMPPTRAKAEAPTALSQERQQELGPMPILHVRWTPALPQPKWAATSLPGAESVAKARATPRPSLAPGSSRVNYMTMGCYGSCSLCNKCGECRKRECNGGCGNCKGCKRCRVWGEQLGRGDEATVRTQEVERQKPAVERRERIVGPKREPARPKAMPKGTSPSTHTMCPYCSQWLPYYHRENCPSMPYEIWAETTRQRAVAKHGREVVDGWPVQCQHCATPFPSPASKRVHLSGCERRRNEAGLPLNSFPVIRNRGVR